MTRTLMLLAALAGGATGCQKAGGPATPVATPGADMNVKPTGR